MSAGDPYRAERRGRRGRGGLLRGVITFSAGVFFGAILLIALVVIAIVALIF